MPSFIRSNAGILGNLVKGMNLLIANKMITPERKDELITEFKTLASNASSIHHVQTLAEEFRIKHNIPRVTSASTTASTTASTAGISSELASVQDIEQIDRDIEQIDQAIEEERKNTIAIQSSMRTLADKKLLQQKVAKEEIRIIKLGIRKITEGYIRSLQKAQTDPDVNEVQRSAIQKTIDDVILSDRELLGFVDVYEKTEYRAEMISRRIDILRYFREKRMISSVAIVEKIKQFQDTHQIIPTERKSVKETIEERRPTYHEMTLTSIAENQKIRKEGVFAFFRNKNVNELYHSKIQAVVDNEIERLKF